MNDDFTVRPCAEDEVEALASFAYRVNSAAEHSSTFCSRSLPALRQELRDSVRDGAAVACWAGAEPIGLLTCYVDAEKGNADASLLMDGARCGEDAARTLLAALRRRLDPGVQLTFFFPRENAACAALLERIHAQRQVNEYSLLLRRGDERLLPSPVAVGNLPPEAVTSFIRLHDEIFPGVYVSGKDIAADLGGKRLIYAMMENGRLAAYSVLRRNGGRRATAEIVAVRKECRGRGYDRAVLSHLIVKAFSEYGAESVDLIVDADNENALSLYLGLGFGIEAEHRCYILPPAGSGEGT